MELVVPPLPLSDVVRELPGKVTVQGDASVAVSGVRHDSRAVEPGDLFVVRKGRTSDGAKFVDAAVAKGARALLVQRDQTEGVATKLPMVLVDNAVQAMAYAAAAVYGHPSFSVDVVGITGTNGKTTTTHLLRGAMDRLLGKPSMGAIGTVGNVFGTERIEATHTTPESDELARIMAHMVRRGAAHIGMEVSSIALDLGRVDAVRFAVAAFTYLTQDHLDFHGDMDSYAAAKAKLFLDHAPGVSVVHVGDAFGASLARRLSSERVGEVVTVSTQQDSDAAFRPVHFQSSMRGLVAQLHTPAGPVELRSPLVGLHNLENLLVVLGSMFALGVPITQAVQALALETGVRGRLERVPGTAQQPVVFVDYAHTPDALLRVLRALRELSPARLICVFGCGGDRDAGKRAPMGSEAGTGADVVFLTSDNPRTEDPEAIARAAELGLQQSGKRRAASVAELASSPGYLVELDRAAAIGQAIALAGPSDIVLIAGKGHETYQIVGTEQRHFDDVEVAASALRDCLGA
jgi:UDP-N-acetylmuramoyl-L-alanyl-D-glutamate--2,6-diaminopimelate ligase